MTSWQNRIVESGTEDPEQLLANPFNARIHPKGQQDALEGILDTVGWVDRVLVNKRTGHVVDGHLRVSLALKRGEKSIPVDYVDLDENEEKTILLSFDWITQMAVYDNQQLDALLRDVNSDDERVQQMLSELAEKQGITDDMMTAPEDFPNYDEGIETEYCCPKCGYKWSGNPNGGGSDE